MMVPGLKLRTSTRCPTNRSFGRACWSCHLIATVWSMVGWRRSSLVLRSRFRNSEAGVTWVVECGVVLYDSRKLISCWWKVSSGWCPVRRACLKVRTKHSAAPLEEGWYGALRICFTWLALRNSLNSSAVNCGPLSDTSCSGNPNEENKRCNSWMIADEVVEIIGITSGHLEWASTTMTLQETAGFCLPYSGKIWWGI